MSNRINSIVTTMGIDIGKDAFHVVGLDQRGAIESYPSKICEGDSLDFLRATMQGKI